MDIGNTIGDGLSYMMGANSNNNNSNGKEGGVFGGYGILILLFLFIFMGRDVFGKNGDNGNQNGDNGMANLAASNAQYNALLAGNNEIRNQISTAGLNSGIDGNARGICDSTFALSNTMNMGFANVNNSLCQGFSGITSAIKDSNYALADRMSIIASQTNLQLQSIQNSQLTCCCEIKQAIAISSQANIQATLTGTQAILEKLCQNEITCLKERLFEQSQEAQTKTILCALTPKLLPAAPAA